MQTFGAIYIGTYEMSLKVYEVSTKIDSDLYMLIMGDEPLVNEKCFCPVYA